MAYYPYTIPMADKTKQEKIYDLADSEDRFVRTGTKKDAKRLGLFTRSIHILLENKQGEVLVCRRPKNKKAYPNRFTSSAGGHVERGESYRVAAVRELKEELGMTTTLRDL